jgi:DNA-binding CsgD family transcriptional regulator
MLGRDDERSAIDDVLTAARGGRSGALVFVGDAGMGKTTLLDHAVATATDFRITRIAGIESEAEFGFATLHRLLLEFLDRLEELPDPQRDALGSAFGLVDGPPPDRFLVGLAALTLLAAVAMERPLLCVIDDAQWVDRESLDTLAFVGRRLYADRMALLFAVRPEPGRQVHLEGLTDVPVGPLGEQHTLELLASVASGPVNVEVARRIVATTEGCPLAVTELARNLTAAQLGGGDVLPDPLPLSGRLERHYIEQVRRLPSDTQLLVLLAAAQSSGDQAALWRAADELGISRDAATPLDDGDLVDLGNRVAFRHPLIRSAVYGGAGAGARRRVHAALARVSDRASELDSHARHLAAASLGPDEEVASELERAALRAGDHGRYAAHAALLTRAAELTPDRERQVDRLLAAAQLHLTAGSPSRARAALDDVRAELADPRRRAQATRLRAALGAYDMPARIPAVLLDAAEDLESLDPRLARDTYAEALEASLVSCQITTGTTPEAIARAALRAPSDKSGDVTMADLMIDAFGTRLGVGYVEAVEPLRRFVAALLADDPAPRGFTRWSAPGSDAAAELWDADGYRGLLLRMEEDERERGGLDALRITLGGLGHCDMWAGRFASSEARHDEATAISTALGAPAFIWEMLKVELFAWQGRVAETRSIVEVLTAHGDRFAGVAVNLALVASTILDLGLGDYDSALATARELFESDSPPQGTQILPELVEAAVRNDETSVARHARDRLAVRARASGSAWALGSLARSDALLASDDRAEALYQEALHQLGRTYVRTDLARVRLLYGEWLRRRQRRVDAREQLRIAHEMFSGMGANAFAERARSELAATGERVRKRAVATSRELTPQEAQIGDLAAAGATNSEIATRLYLSAATIDYHLRKVYRKLGVSSRRELRKVLPDSARLVDSTS